MRIKAECIGQAISVKAPNGVQINVTINENPENFSLYKMLGLDVFDNTPKAKVSEVEVKKKGKK